MKTIPPLKASATINHSSKSPLSAPVLRIRWLEPSEWPAWDAFASQHPLGSIFTTSTWKNVLESSFPHIKSRFVVLFNPANNQIQAGLPFYSVSSPLLGNRFVSIPFASFCDPLVSSSEDLSALLQWTLAHSPSSSANPMELRTWRSLKWARTSPLIQTNLYKHHYLVLAEGNLELPPLLSKHSFRRSVEKARKNGLSVIRASNPGFLTSFHVLLSQGRKLLGLPAIPLSFFKSLHSECNDKGLVLMQAVQNGEPVAGIILLIHNGICDYEYVANSPSARSDGVQQLMLLEAVKLAVTQGCHLFSWGRTSPTNEGLMAYKRRFSNDEEDIAVFSNPRTKPRLSTNREKTWTYHLARQAFTHLPRPAYNLLSNWYYRHLG